MSKLPLRTQQVCMEIMQNIMSKPCAAVFLDPVNPEESKLVNYNTIVKHPIDLTTIYHRLENGEYPNITQWDKDMNLIWSNAEKYFKKGSYMSIVASEIQRIYIKEYEKIKVLRLAKWAKVVNELKLKLEKLYDNPPPFIAAVSQMQQLEHDEKLKPFSEDELNTFIHMASYLDNTDDSKKMMHIINYFQPNTLTDTNPVKLDVNDLQIPTLHALREFVSHKVAEMNIKYPR